MSSIVYPQMPSLVRQPGGKFKVSKEGVASATERYIGPYNLCISSPDFSIDSPHPDFPGLLVYDRSAERRRGRLENGMPVGLLELEYRGLDPSFSGGGPGSTPVGPSGPPGLSIPGSGVLPPPVYSLDRSTAAEPIDTHPKFISDIGGTKIASKNGAEFDKETGIFIGFNSESKYRGVDSYLCAGLVWNKNYLAYSAPIADLDDVGYISRPEGGAPTPRGMNWISLGCSWTKQGGVYQIQKSWRLSGIKGWDTVIYGR